jgi:hypothetical protein
MDGEIRDGGETDIEEGFFGPLVFYQPVVPQVLD